MTAQSKITALITGMGGGGLGEQIVKALRMAETEYTLIGTDISSYSAGLPLVDIPYIVPLANHSQYIEKLLSICGAHNVQALFPSSEAELKVVSDHRDIFIDAGILLPINPSGVLETCFNKVQTFQKMELLGFPVLPYRQFATVEEVMDFEFFPAVLKPASGGGGSANLFLVQNQKELLLCAQQMLQLVPHCLIQAYAGTPQDEYTTGVLLDIHGQYINTITLRRQILSALSNRIKAPNLSGNSSLGPVLAISSGISQGEIDLFPEVNTFCKRLALALGAKSAINIQCRISSTGEIYVMEINPRFSGTAALRAMVGFNEPDILIRKHLCHENIPVDFPYKTGIILRRLEEVLVDQASIAAPAVI